MPELKVYLESDDNVISLEELQIKITAMKNPNQGRINDLKRRRSEAMHNLRILKRRLLEERSLTSHSEVLKVIDFINKVDRVLFMMDEV